MLQLLVAGSLLPLPVSLRSWCLCPRSQLLSLSGLLVVSKCAFGSGCKHKQLIFLDKNTWGLLLSCSEWQQTYGRQWLWCQPMCTDRQLSTWLMFGYEKSSNLTDMPACARAPRRCVWLCISDGRSFPTGNTKGPEPQCSSICWKAQLLFQGGCHMFPRHWAVLAGHLFKGEQRLCQEKQIFCWDSHSHMQMPFFFIRVCLR